MSSEKRLFLFMIVSIASVMCIQYVMEVAGLNPPPPKPPVKAQGKADGAKPDSKPEQVAADKALKDEKRAELEKKRAAKEEEAKAKQPRIEVAIDPRKLVIGSAADKTPG